MSALAIETHDLVKEYPGGVRALDGVSLRVETGGIVALLGPNGAGKTTVVRILTTLSRATSGRASVAGVDVVADPGRVRETIGVVAQRAGLDPVATGRENLTLQGRFFGLAGAPLRTRVAELLDAFGLADDADRPAATYSGGMARRLDIAMGLVHRPTVLFLDEPTVGLDPEIRAALWTEIGRLAATEGLTILLTTHYLEEADRLARRIAILDRGRIVASGTPEDLKAGLRGDALTLELRERADESIVRSALAAVPGVDDIHLEDRTVHLRVAHGASSLPGVLGALDANALPVAAATISRPSLDDVYLRHTGRSFTTAERVLEGAAR